MIDISKIGIFIIFIGLFLGIFSKMLTWNAIFGTLAILFSVSSVIASVLFSRD